MYTTCDLGPQIPSRPFLFGFLVTGYITAFSDHFVFNFKYVINALVNEKNNGIYRPSHMVIFKPCLC